MDAIILDFAKAFDKVSHAHQLIKLQRYKGLPYFPKATSGDRGPFFGLVKCNIRCASREYIIGPLLFLVYIKDLPSSVSCNSDLFADDTALHRQIDAVLNCEQFQEDLPSGSDWCKSWLVTLKTEKCKVLH